MLTFLQAKHDLDFKAKEKLAILQRETDEFKNQNKTQNSNVIFYLQLLIGVKFYSIHFNFLNFKMKNAKKGTNSNKDYRKYQNRRK